MNQVSEFYNNHQILLYPVEQSLRDPNVYAHQVVILDQETGRNVYETYYNCDEIFWCGLDTQDKLMAMCRRIVDKLESDDE